MVALLLVSSHGSELRQLLSEPYPGNLRPYRHYLFFIVSQPLMTSLPIDSSYQLEDYIGYEKRISPEKYSSFVVHSGRFASLNG